MPVKEDDVCNSVRQAISKSFFSTSMTAKRKVKFSLKTVSRFTSMNTTAESGLSMGELASLIRHKGKQLLRELSFLPEARFMAY